MASARKKAAKTTNRSTMAGADTPKPGRKSSAKSRPTTRRKGR